MTEQNTSVPTESPVSTPTGYAAFVAEVKAQQADNALPKVRAEVQLEVSSPVIPAQVRRG